MNEHLDLYTSFKTYLDTLSEPKQPGNPDGLLKHDEQEQLPLDFLNKIHEWGYCDYLVPKAYGGKFHDLTQVYLLTKSIAYHDVTSAIVRGLALFFALPIWISGSESQKKWFATKIMQGEIGSIALTEKDHGSDITKNETYATLDGQYYIINGSKWAINHATDCFASVLLVRTSSQSGPLSYSLMILDNQQKHAGLKYIPRLKTHGARGMNVGGFEFNHLKIFKENMVGKAGQGISLTFKTLQLSRTLCAALSSGAAERAITLTFNFVQQRILYGNNIAHIAAVRQRLAESYARFVVADIFTVCVTRAASFYPKLLSLWSALIKFSVPNHAESIMNHCAKILGARGFIRNSDDAYFQKIRRDNELIGLFDGSSEVNLTIIGNHLVQQAKLRQQEQKYETRIDVYDLEKNIPEFNFQQTAGFCQDIDLLSISTDIDSHPAIQEQCQHLMTLLKQLDDTVLTRHREKTFNPQDLAIMQLSEKYSSIIAGLCALRYCQINNNQTYLKPVINLYLTLLATRNNYQEIDINLYNEVFDILKKQMIDNKNINIY